MLLKVYPENPNEREIKRIVDALRDGAVMIYPTDTVYAFGCDIFQPKAVERICRLKKIDAGKARFSIICNDLSNISEFAKVDNPTFKLMKKNLPGAFTFILNGSNNLPKLFKNRKTIGIRIPDNNIAREIVRLLGHPILSSSVKIGDAIEYESDPELLHQQYEKLVDITIDGGFGLDTPSTVVDCTENEFNIIRQGFADLLF